MVKSIILILILLSGIQVQAKENRQHIYDFLSSYECSGGPGRHLVAYPDYKGYSIGCGTPSYKWEKITVEEWWRRFYMYTDIRVDLVKKHFPDISGSKQIALVSLAANNGTCYYEFVKGRLTEYLWREKCDNVRVNGKLKELKGLHLRRNAEADLYFGKK